MGLHSALAPRHVEEVMSRPSDASIAKAFWELCDSFEDGAIVQNQLVELAQDFDTDAAAPAPFERCPKCTAHLPPGKHCAGESCPLRKT